MALKGIFDRHGYRYTLGIVADWLPHPENSPLPRSELLTADDLRAFVRDGYEIASHSFSHPPLMPREAFFLYPNIPGAPAPSTVLTVTSETVSLTVDDRRFETPHTTLGSFVEQVDSFLKAQGIPLTASVYDQEQAPLSTARLASAAAQSFDGAGRMTFELVLGTTQEALLHELGDSRALLEQTLGVTVQTLIYPYTSNTAVTRRAARSSGYRVARAGHSVGQLQVWDCYYKGVNYPGSIVVSGGTNVIDSLNLVDVMHLPMDWTFENALLDVQQRYESSKLDLDGAKEAIRDSVDRAVAGNLWVHLYDHAGTYHQWLWDALLEVLSENPKVKVLPIGKAYDYLAGKDPLLQGS